MESIEDFLKTLNNVIDNNMFVKVLKDLKIEIKDNKNSIKKVNEIDFKYTNKNIKQDVYPINVATVFSGIGAPEQALKRLGIKHNLVFACDIDKYCKQTYFANYKITEDQWYNDIKK